MTTSHSLPSSPTAGSALDGDPRVLIPLPEAAERLGISRWQAYKLARSGRLPTTRLGARGRVTAPGPDSQDLVLASGASVSWSWLPRLVSCRRWRRKGTAGRPCVGRAAGRPLVGHL